LEHGQQEPVIAHLVEHARVRDLVEQAQRLFVDQVDDDFIVLELNLAEINVLAAVLFLFQLEHVFDKQVVQAFVGVVDEQLLKSIVLIKNLKPENVQNADEHGRRVFVKVGIHTELLHAGALNPGVDLFHEDGKRAAVQLERQRLT